MDNFEVELLFKAYRSKYDLVLDKFNKGKRDPYQITPEIKIDGRMVGVPSLTTDIFDSAIHTCGSQSNLDGIQSGNYFETHWTYQVNLSKDQETYLQSAYSQIEFDLDIFHDSVKNAKGMWPEYLYQSRFRKQQYPENQSGQQGDVLGIISKNFFRVLSEIAANPLFKKIDKYDPRERLGIISDKLFRIFVYANYKCDHFQKVCCRICERDFLPQIESKWVGIVPPIYCGVCVEMSASNSTSFFRHLNYSVDERRQNYIFGVKAYCDYFGFIPAAGSSKRTFLSQFASTGVDSLTLDLAMKVSSLLPFHTVAKEMFGSWAHLLSEAGLLEERASGYGGHQSIATDGHLCLSLGERAICEFLNKNHITHSKEPLYPQDPKLNVNGLLRADFLIGDLWVEFAGRMDNPAYAERMKIKSKLAKKYDLKWLKLERSTVEDLQSILIKIENA